jgi:2-polyprenyl-6-methoxyphenol hydroxylase-like FAD-dependent oxidoreductase
MSSPRRILVVGGGTAGSSLAILLRRAGLDVTLAEIQPGWNVSGSGITLQGNALRVLREVGVLGSVRDQGFSFNTLGLTAPDGTVLHVAEDIRTGGQDLPAAVGMQRADLQAILVTAARASGARIRLGAGVESLSQDALGVDVRFGDGTSGRFDLVVGADGRSSATRALIGITDRPVPTGMGIWRTPAPRPKGLERTDLAYGGPCYVAGYCPTGDTTIYAYLVEPKRDRGSLDPAAYAAEMRRLAEGYGGHWAEIRKAITDQELVNYTWCDRLLVDGPWHRGRVVLAGDAAHSCPPTLAQGAAMSLEDVSVLAELLTTHETWDDELLTGYWQRRLPRVQLVVDASVQLGQWLMDGVRDADVPGLIGRAMTALKERP